MCNSDLPNTFHPDNGHKLKVLRFPDATVDADLIRTYAAAVSELDTFAVARVRPGTDVAGITSQPGCNWKEVQVMLSEDGWGELQLAPITFLVEPFTWTPPGNL